jgi:subtilase family serine protease
MKNVASYLQHLVLPLCLSATALVTGPAIAQASGAAQARISAEISSSRMTALPNSQQPLARPELETGRLASTTKLEGVTIHFSRSKSQQADLDKLIAAQQDPSSPQYHQWLTPEQFGARFGMADSDIAKVQSWLEQQGFAVEEIGRSKNSIRFSGTVAQVERAFATEMHTYNLTVNGKVEKHIAPSTGLSVPSALAGIVQSVRNLHNFQPRAHVVASRAAAISRPHFSSGTSGAVFFAPGDIAVEYDVNNAYKSGFTGTGQTIAIIGQSDVLMSDIEAFQNAAGLPVKDPTKFFVPGSGNDGNFFANDESESDLDLEWSGAIAKGADIKFVFTGTNTQYGAFDSLLYAVDNSLANIISSSYGTCETEFVNDQSDLNTLESSLQQASAQGQTVMSAAGDDGSTDCFGDSNLTAAQQEALAVDYPASSAYVTGVGGTMVSSDSAAYLTSGNAYWKAGSGSDIVTSLLQYVPEVVWNEDSKNEGCGQTDCLISGGGGASAFFAKPSWQTGVPGIPTDSKRYVPDLSLQASVETPGYLFCTSDTSFWDLSGGQVASCNSGFRDSATGILTRAGGTSFATPIFAGMVAIINQQQGYTTGQGLINQKLYTLASNPATYESAFHDITGGDNDCRGGSADCNGTPGFSATAGYDQATGLGTVDLSNLASAWPAFAGAAISATTTTVTPSNTAPTVNTADAFTISVVSASGTTPTGTVTITVDNDAPITDQALAANGTYVYTATFTTAGTHTVLATYSGDAANAASSGQAIVTVAGTSSGTGTFKITATNVTVAQGSSGSSTITVTPAGGYKGTVEFTASTNNANLANGCYTVSNATVTGTAAATTTLSFDTNGTDCANANIRQAKHLQRITLSGGSKPNTKSSGKTTSAAAIFAGLLLAGFLGRYSKKLRVLAGVILLVTFGFALSGCGGGSSSNSNDVPKGTYSLTLTGQDSAVATIPQATTTFNVTVN